MSLEMTVAFRDAIVRLLVSCGGTTGAMQNIAARIQRSESNNLGEILGGLLDVPGPMQEIVATCEATNEALDLEGLIRHFASPDHLRKMTRLKATVAAELSKEQIPFAHTLLPLSIVGGKYYYDCGDTFVELTGLVQIGLVRGTPYAHLAGLIWLSDEGLHTQILTEQAENGVAASGKKFTKISYYDAPTLREGTIAGAEALFGSA